MSQTYVQPGHTLSFVAPTGGVTIDVPVVMGTLVVIPHATADAGATFEGAISGVHKVTKADSQAWTILAALYWDATNSVFTTSATGNTAAGKAAAPVASTAGLTTGYVLLNGLPGCCG